MSFIQDKLQLKANNFIWNSERFNKWNKTI